MDKCKIHIIIGDNDIIIDDVANDGNISTIYNQIKDKLVKSNQFDTFKDLVLKSQAKKYGNIQDGKLIANTTTEEICRNLGIKFPVSSNNILLVDSCRINGKEVYGKVKDAFGKELYIVRNNQSSLIAFSNFLQLEQKIKDYQFKQLPSQYKNESELKKDLIEFLQKGEKFVDFKSNKVKELLDKYSELKNIIKMLSQKPIKPIVQDKFSQSIIDFLRYKKQDGKFIPYITVSKFKSLMSIYMAKDSNIFEVLNNHFLDQPDVSLRFDRIDEEAGNIVFNYFGDTVQNKYNSLNADNIGQLVKYESDYKGYYIFSIGTNFIISKNWLTLNTTISNKYFNSLIEAKKEIDNKNGQSKISNNFVPELHQTSDLEGLRHTFSTSKIGNKDEVIRALDVIINPTITIHSPDIYIKYQDMSLNKFVETIKSQYKPKEDINSIIDTNEKAMVLLHNLGENNIDEVLQAIKAAKYKYYIIENIGNKRAFKFQTTLFRINQEDLGLTIKEPTYKYVSMFNVLNKINTQMEKSFGFSAEILSATQIKEQFGEILGPGIEQEKSFIYNDKIYVNASEATASDLVHEYLHMFLGALKVMNFDTYNKVIGMVSNTEYFNTMKQLMSNNFRYSNLADSDLNEEVFVKILSKHLTKETDSSIDKSLHNAASLIERTLFPKSDLGSNVLQFTNDYAESGDMDIIKPFIDESQIYRKVTNYITDGIENNKIIENCK